MVYAVDMSSVVNEETTPGNSYWWGYRYATDSSAFGDRWKILESVKNGKEDYSANNAGFEQ